MSRLLYFGLAMLVLPVDSGFAQCNCEDGYDIELTANLIPNFKVEGQGQGPATKISPKLLPEGGPYTFSLGFDGEDLFPGCSNGTVTLECGLEYMTNLSGGWIKGSSFQVWADSKTTLNITSFQVRVSKGDTATPESEDPSPETAPDASQENPPSADPATGTVTAPGVRITVNAGLIGLGTGGSAPYRSAGVLTWGGLVDPIVAKPVNVAYNTVGEVAPLTTFGTVSGYAEEKHLRTPSRLFRVTGYTSNPESNATFATAPNTYIREYIRESASELPAATIARGPVSWWKISAVTDGIKVEQSLRGIYKEKTYVSDDPSSLVVSNGTATISTMVPPPPVDGGSYTTESQSERDGVVISKIFRNYVKVGNRFEIASETKFPEPEAEEPEEYTTYYGYYPSTAPGEAAGKLWWTSRPNGSWEIREYTTDARGAYIYTPFESEVTFNASLVSQSYLPLQPAPGFTGTTARVRKTMSISRDEFVVSLQAAATSDGVKVKKGTNIFEVPVPNLPSVEDSRSDAIPAGIPLVSKGRTISYSQDIPASSANRWLAGRTILDYEDDGSAEYYEYYKGTDGTLGEIVRVTKTSGYVTDPASGDVTVGELLFGPVSNFSEQTIEIYGAKGLLKREKKYHTGSGFSSASVEVLNYDSTGRYTSTTIDGIVTHSVIWSDSLTKVETDERGQGTTTKFNDDGEVLWTEDAEGGGVDAIRTTYHRYGRTTTTRINGVTNSVVTVDGLGRVVSRKDATGAESLFLYPDGGRTVKTILPGGITLIDSGNLDGSLRSRGGSGQVAEFHSTDVVAGQEGYIKLSSTGSAGSHSERMIRRRYNADDKLQEVVKPSGSGSGKLVSESYQYSGAFAVASYSSETEADGSPTSDLPRKLFYPSAIDLPDTAHALGKTRTSGLDLSGDDVLSFSDTVKDRYSKREISYLLVGGSVHRKTTDYSYPSQSESVAVITETLESLGFDKQGTDSYRTTRKMTRSSAGSSRSVTTTTLVTPGTATVVTTEDDTASTFGKVTIAENGYVQSVASSQDGVNETFTYDSFGRISKYTDARNAATFSYRDGFQLSDVTDQLRGTISYTYYLPTERHAGKLKTITKSGGITETTAYTDRGEVAGVSGSGSYRVDYSYDVHGAMETLTTYRTPTSPAVTTWTYQHGTGLLEAKRYADNKGFDYQYTPDWKLKKRTSAEGVVTDYVYDPATRDLTNVTYSGDNNLTPDVTFSNFDGLGRPTQVSEARTGGSGAVGTDASVGTSNYVTTQTLSYQPHSKAVSISYASDHRWLPNAKVLHAADDALGRPKGFDVMIGTTPVSEQDYHYDALSRLEKVTSSDLEGGIGYQPGTDILQKVSVKLTSTGAVIHERKLAIDLLGRTVGVTNKAGTSVGSLEMVASLGHEYDDAGRRSNARREDGTRWDYSYNSRSEVEGAVKKIHNTTSSEQTAPGMVFNYRYDGIGNRTKSWSGEDSSEENATWEYAPNVLNQYAQIDHSGRFDLLSRSDTAVTPSTLTSGASVVSGGPFDQGNLRGARMQLGNANGGKVVTTTLTRSGSPPKSVKTWVPDDAQAVTYDDDGNLENDGRWIYKWDGEGRLVSMTPVTVSGVPVGGAPKVELRFAYDWMGRRVGKSTVDTTSGSAVYTHVSYAYDYWNPVAEWERSSFVVNSAPRPLTGTGVLKRTHLWGLDIGSNGEVGVGSREHFQQAGGVAGLVASTRHDVSPKDHFVPGYDANGNVIVWSDGGGTLVQRLDYEPFGNKLLVEELSSKAANLPAFGFSTKLYDKEVGLYYYGHRYYDAGTGRWLSKDPIGENGGKNLYGFLANNGLNNWDLLGLECPPAGYADEGWNDSQKSFFGQMAGQGKLNPSLVGNGRSGRDFMNHLESLTQQCCCIKDLRVAGHGGANGLGGADEGQTGFYGVGPEVSDEVGPGHPSRKSRDVQDLQEAIKDGKIKFCPGCVIKIHACGQSPEFLESLASATGCKVIGGSGNCSADPKDEDEHGNDSADSDWTNDGGWMQSDGGLPVTDLPGGNDFDPNLPR